MRAQVPEPERLAQEEERPRRAQPLAPERQQEQRQVRIPPSRWAVVESVRATDRWPCRDAGASWAGQDKAALGTVDRGTAAQDRAGPGKVDPGTAGRDRVVLGTAAQDRAAGSPGEHTRAGTPAGRSQEDNLAAAGTQGSRAGASSQGDSLEAQIPVADFHSLGALRRRVAVRTAVGWRWDLDSYTRSYVDQRMPVTAKDEQISTKCEQNSGFMGRKKSTLAQSKRRADGSCFSGLMNDSTTAQIPQATIRGRFPLPKTAKTKAIDDLGFQNLKGRDNIVFFSTTSRFEEAWKIVTKPLRFSTRVTLRRQR